MTLLTHTATAYDFMVDGLAYSIRSNGTAGVTYTQERLGSNYSGLTEAIIPERVTYNGKTYSVTAINTYAFYYCKNLKIIKIPNSVTYIGNEVLAECSSLENIILQSNSKYDSRDNCNAIIETASNTLIAGCKNSFIPNTIKTIGTGAFNGCIGLTSITIPNSVTSIGDWAFSGCSSLREFTIPNSIIEIGPSAFRSCSNLETLTIGNSVSRIAGTAFLGCTNLTRLIYKAKNCKYDEYNVSSDYMFNGGNIHELIFGNEVECIPSRFMSKQKFLTTFTIPNSVTEIGSSAFARCPGLTSISIPNSVTEIGSHAFEFCSSLSNITFPNSITHIGNDAFYGTPWLNNQPDGLVYAGRVAYQYKGTMPEGTSIAIKDGTVSISDDAFSSCTGLESVTIPNSVTTIGGGAFSGCTSLSSITIPNSVTRIGGSAFYGTPWLNNQPDGLVYVNRVAYLYKGTMPEGTSIAIKDGTVSVSDYAFYNQVRLESITIPSSVTEVGDWTFSQCTNLKYVLCYAKLDRCPAYPLVVPYDLYNHYKSISINLLLYIYPIYAISKPTCHSTTMTTATGIRFTCSYLESPAITDCGIRIGNTKIRGNVTDNGDGQLTVTIDEIIGLTPGGCWITPYVTTHGIDLFGDGFNLPTKPVTDFETITPTVFSLSQFDDEETASIKKLEIYFDGAPVDGRSITGLIPGSSHTVRYRITSINTYKEISTTITTPQPILEVQAARMLSNTSPMLAANTNLADEETSCGFEWRRYDAPEELPSAQVYSPVFDGTMAGVLKNMSENVYYKYRPFLKDANGTMYYGDWIAFITADAGVEYEPILYSYKNPEVTQTEATLQGVALPGSSDITEQGFEYWRSTGGNNAPAAAPTGSVTKVKSSGQRMRTTVEGLAAGATYCFRSYAVSGGKTYYGDEVKFATEKPAAGNGDVNGDGRVDVEDVNAVINIILKQKAITDYDGIADVTGDGRVDVEDVNAIINIILKV